VFHRKRHGSIRRHPLRSLAGDLYIRMRWIPRQRLRGMTNCVYPILRLCLTAFCILTGAFSAYGSGCQFLSSPGATAAFCDDLTAGPMPGGRAGDLDSRKWSISRIVGDNNSSTTLLRFPQTPVSACKTGVVDVNSDNDVLVCDSASGHQGQFLTAMSAQNYGLLSLRPRQPFDFAGRTGTVSFNVDALTEGGLSWWTSLFVTDEPNAGANDTTPVTGEIPRNGLGMNFDDNCGTSATQMRVNNVYVFNNYAETQVPLSNTACVQTQRGFLNHIEVRLSQTTVEVWASDYSPDGQTYPNFRQVGSAPISLGFSRGYVHFQQEERAPVKYAIQFNISPGYTNNYWSNLGFDGPVVAGDTGYEIPDPLTSNPNGGLNLGYGLLTAPYSTYTCCSAGAPTTIAPFVLPNVDLTGVTSAKLTFGVTYTFDATHTPSTIAFHYRINGGTWKNPNPSPDYSKAFYCATCPFPPANNASWAAAYSFPVVLSDLKQGSNTIEFSVDGTMNGYPPVLANIDLLSMGGASPPPPSPCDVNVDGTTNVADVQLEVNMAIGVAPCTADINNDGICNVIDVQRVVNAVLGGLCVSP